MTLQFSLAYGNVDSDYARDLLEQLDFNWKGTELFTHIRETFQIGLGNVIIVSEQSESLRTPPSLLGSSSPADSDNSPPGTPTNGTQPWFISEDLSKGPFTETQATQSSTEIPEVEHHAVSSLHLKLNGLSCIGRAVWRATRKMDARTEVDDILNSITEPRRLTLPGINKMRQCIVRLLLLVPIQVREEILSFAIASGIPSETIEDIRSSTNIAAVDTHGRGIAHDSKKRSLAPTQDSRNLRRRIRGHTQ